MRRSVRIARRGTKLLLFGQMYAFEPSLRTSISGLPCTNRSDMISKVLTEVTRIRELCNPPPELGYLCIIVVISAHHGRTSPKFMDPQRRDEQLQRPTPLVLGGRYVGQLTVHVDTVFLTSKYPNLASCLITCQGCAGMVSSSHLSINCPCTQNPPRLA